jgi:hypothetical protein
VLSFGSTDSSVNLDQVKRSLNSVPANAFRLHHFINGSGVLPQRLLRVRQLEPVLQDRSDPASRQFRLVAKLRQHLSRFPAAFMSNWELISASRPSSSIAYCNTLARRTGWQQR